MTASKGFVVPADGGKHLPMSSPGHSTALKLFGHETKGSIMLFEQTVPAGPVSDDEPNRLLERHHWEIVGPNPL